MGVTIQAESHHVELAALYEYEHDPRTLEFYDQPPPIKLVYEAKRGRQVGVWHTPDYFVLQSDAAGWEEWKTEAGLERLAETMPHRYLRDETGHWRCPPISYTQGSELLKRLQADACELCGSTIRVEVHHLRKMADLNRHKRKQVPTWFRLMAARKRKTLIACRACHEAIHAGRPTKQALSA